jgi:hypothetical protein
MWRILGVFRGAFEVGWRRSQLTLIVFTKILQMGFEGRIFGQV